MQVRRIGGNGLVSSAVGLGSLAFTGRYGPADKTQCMRIVRDALDLGVTMLDTADSYRSGDVERLIGRAVASRRDEVVIATRASGGGAASGAARGKDLRTACEASLRRLGTNHIDLYYLDIADRSAPVEVSVHQLGELVSAGKIRYIGLAGASADQLRRGHAVHPISAFAGEYSLWAQEVASGPLLTARELGIGIVACRPLGRGFLAGRIVSPDQFDVDDDRRNDARFWPDNLQSNRKLLQAAEQVATQKHLGLARLALAWLLSGGEDIVPIPATRNRVHLEMNTAAVGVRLTRDERGRLAALFPPGLTSGRPAP
jgi:aryl-alcohol dehydrogenase-like predicted oxidoreductase